MHTSQEITRRRLARLAVLADVDVRTATSFLAGLPVSKRSRERLEAALAELDSDNREAA